MTSQSLIWQSPLLRFFLLQQQMRYFRGQASSTIFLNLCALCIAGLERYYQSIIWLVPALAEYATQHSTICLAAIVLFAYNALNLGVRYLHWSYKLNSKFVVNTEEEKADLSRSFHLIPGASPDRVLALNRPASPQSQLGARATVGSPDPSSPQRQRQLLLLQSVYLPSASPKSPSRLHQPSSPLPRQPPSPASPQQLQQHSFSPIRCAPSPSLQSPASPSPAGPYPGSGGEFAHLSRLSYQPGQAVQRPPRRQVTLPPCCAQDSPQQQSQQQQLQLQHQLSQSPHSLTQAVLPHTEALRLLGLESAGLDRWLRGMRAWLHGSIVEPLNRDVERLNASGLRIPGVQHDVTIGIASLQQLQQLQGGLGAAVQPNQTLGQLMPYLSACEDQGYLARRLADLANVPCLGGFRWDSGGAGWSDRLPNDSTLLMSLLSAYLDRCLPPLPGTSKPFSSVYVSPQPSSSIPQQQQQQQQQHHNQQQTATDELRILQASRQPPHLQLLLTQAAGQPPTVLDLAQGPRNLFYCLLAFFYHRWARRGGRLGQISLGESGLNLAWIFEGVE